MSSAWTDIDRDEDRDDRPRRRKPQKKQGASPLIVALGVTGGVLAFILYYGGLVFLEMRKPPLPKELEGAASVQPLLTREEFKKELIGKTEKEVLQRLGRPERTTEYSSSVVWTYYGLTHDPIAKRVDLSSSVKFKDGKVIEVDY